MKPKLRVVTFGVGCFTVGFLTCYLFLSQPHPAPKPPVLGPATTTAPVGGGTGLTIPTGIVTPTNIVIRGPDRWQWADGTVHDSPPPGSAQRDLGLIDLFLSPVLGPATTTAPVGGGTGLTLLTRIVTPTNIVIRGPDRWQWADGTVHDAPPPGSAQRDLGLIDTRPQPAPDIQNPK